MDEHKWTKNKQNKNASSASFFIISSKYHCYWHGEKKEKNNKKIPCGFKKSFQFFTPNFQLLFLLQKNQTVLGWLDLFAWGLKKNLIDLLIMGKRMNITQNKISLKMDAYNISKIYMADPLILGKSMAIEIRWTGVWLIAILVQIFKVNSSKFSQSM